MGPNSVAASRPVPKALHAASPSQADADGLADPMVLVLGFQALLIVLFGACTCFGPASAPDAVGDKAASTILNFYPMLQVCASGLACPRPCLPALR